MATQLATLAQIKEYLEVSNGNDDALLTRLIDVCSSSIEKWCSRVFGVASYVITVDGTGKSYVMVDPFPIISVTSVTVNEQAIPLSTGLTVGGYYFKAPYQIMLRGGRTFPRGSQNVVISYSAGYATLPADIVQACVKLVALRYRERDRLGISGKTVGGENVSFSNDDFPPSIERVLNEYRSVIFT
jgi:uncharacterized phiE125 gp8 family phage protein